MIPKANQLEKRICQETGLKCRGNRSVFLNSWSAYITPSLPQRRQSTPSQTRDSFQIRNMAMTTERSHPETQSPNARPRVSQRLPKKFSKSSTRASSRWAAAELTAALRLVAPSAISVSALSIFARSAASVTFDETKAH